MVSTSSRFSRAVSLVSTPRSRLTGASTVTSSGGALYAGFFLAAVFFFWAAGLGLGGLFGFGGPPKASRHWATQSSRTAADIESYDSLSRNPSLPAAWAAISSDQRARNLSSPPITALLSKPWDSSMLRMFWKAPAQEGAPVSCVAIRRLP